MAASATPVWDVLVFVVLPLWLIAGVADYLCHRAEHIEQGTGARESALHWLMLGETGIALAAATWLRVNALVFAFLLGCLVVHELTSHIDGRYARRTRHIGVFEFQVHTLLEMMPFAALLLLAVLHWPQAEALFGLGREHADWTLALKEPPSLRVVLPFAFAFFLFGVVPYAEEFWRGLRASRGSAARVRGLPPS